MKKYLYKLSLCFVIFIACSLSTVNASEINLSDIEEHWAREKIKQLIADGVISGYSDGTFRPENNITVNEFLKMLIVAGDYQLVREGNHIYPDFYIATAKEYGIIDVEETVDFNSNLTRYQMVQIVSNFIGIEDVKANKNFFKDLDKSNKEQVLKLVSLEIVNGYEDKTFRGENNITRAEATCVLCKTIEAREKVIVKRKYEVEKEIFLSNYRNSSSEQKSIKTFYELVGNKIKIYDSGRYAKLDGYEVSNQKINIEKVIKIIRKIVNEKAYVGVIYVPSKYTINELKILYGNDETKVLCGEYDFAFNYYEDKEYKLASKSLHPEFSDNCYLRIDVIKLWDDESNYKNGVYVDEYKKEKLESALKLEFGSASSRILDYMIDKNIKYVTNVERDKEHVEQKVFGNYIVNYYQKEYGIPQFYIERK